MTAQEQKATGMPGRYATALFELAQESNSVSQVSADLDTFAAMLDSSDDLTRLVRSPVFGAGEQVAALNAVFAQAGIKSVAANFIKLTASNRRLFAVRDMIGAFRSLVAEARGEIAAEVVSAEKLTAAQLSKLKAELKASVGSDVELATTVDPSILGGLIVKVGSRMVDNSLRTKLQNLKVSMKGVS
ncbi:MAG: F0F1 ATP synthase subunit delta [Pseudomonadota bacterium]